MPKLPSERGARSVNLTPLAADTARPGVAPKGVDHRATDSPLGEGLELDPAALVEATGCVDEPKDPVLDEIANVDGVGHGRRHPASQGFNERQAGNDSPVLIDGLDAHLFSLPTCRLKRFEVFTPAAGSMATAIPTVEF
jgi:hypothetical protein